jgi:hypothetical protein
MVELKLAGKIPRKNLSQSQFVNHQSQNLTAMLLVTKTRRGSQELLPVGAEIFWLAIISHRVGLSRSVTRSTKEITTRTEVQNINTISIGKSLRSLPN